MRIARAVMVVLLLVGAFSLLLAGERLWRAHTKVVQDEQLAALANVRSDWYEGIVALSFERSVTQVALALDTAIPPAFLQLIEQQRVESDRLLRQAQGVLVDKPSFLNRAVFSDQVRATRAAIADLRAYDDALNQIKLKAISERDLQKLDAAVERETVELAAIGTRLYLRAQEVIARVRLHAGDVAIAASVSGKNAAEMATAIVNFLRPVMQKLSELLTALPPVV
jgi:hypothetical protein